MADVAKGTGSLVKANQARTHARAHTHTHRIRKRSNFSSSHVAGTHLPAFLPSSASSLAPIPTRPTLRSLLSSNLALGFLSSCTGNRGIYIYIYIYARISPVSGEKKGVFLEITTGEYLEEEHPSRFRSGGERGGSRCRERILSREWEEDGEGGRCVRK